jgi:hypothetical protein
MGERYFPPSDVRLAWTTAATVQQQTRQRDVQLSVARDAMLIELEEDHAREKEVACRATTCFAPRQCIAVHRSASQCIAAPLSVAPWDVVHPTD